MFFFSFLFFKKNPNYTHFISCPLLSNQCFWRIIFTNLLLPASSCSVLIKSVYLGEREPTMLTYIHLFRYNVQLTGGGAEWTDQDFRVLAILTEIKACVDVCVAHRCARLCVCNICQIDQ